jgi:hypothetical protein
LQKSDFALATTHYEVKPRIIKLVATNPFRVLEDDNPYRHIKEFTMICNTVQQKGVPAAWFKWNIFPFSLEDEARRWYTLVFVEAKENWDELVKKFLLKFFRISKVQDKRRQVLSFKQGEDEEIDEAWDYFNELLEQGPNLGFFGDLMLHTFYISLTPNSSRFVSMCAGGDIVDKTISEAAQILQRIINGKRIQQEGKRRCQEEQNDKSKPEVLAENSEKDEPEVKKDEPNIQETEDPLPKSREVISDIKNIETNMNVGRSMGNARPLAEFNQSGWIQVDFAPLINYRRKEKCRHVAKLVGDMFDQEMSGEWIQNIFEEEREEDDEGWIDRFDNSKISDEEREEYNRDESSDSKDKWEKIGLKLEDEWEGVDIEQVLQKGTSPQGYSLCAIETYTLENQDMEAHKDEEKSESMMSDLDKMNALKMKIWLIHGKKVHGR